MIGYFVFLFIATSWLSYFSNPKYIHIENEKMVLEKIKDKYNISAIESIPIRNIEENKPSITYKVYVYDKRYCIPDKIKLEKEAKAIFNEISFIKLPSNVNKYEIVFCCKLYNPNGISFEYYTKENIINEKK